VLLRLTDSAILPNDFRMQIQHCVVVGAAVADLASERVAIRTETLSCLLRSGGFITIDEPLKGHVVGNDGRLGLRARIVQKEGQLIARSLVAGFLSGLSDAFKPRIAYAPIQLGGSDVTENRSFTLPPMQDTLAAAGLSGVGKSMDLLAKHYVTLAEKVAPVAEVPSGVPVDIVILQGIPLRWRSAKTADPHPALID
jgi:conjugal transfer pilus assembly protein TraB